MGLKVGFFIFLFHFGSESIHAMVPRQCADIISGLDGDVIWTQEITMGTAASAPNSPMLVILDGETLQGLRIKDGSIRWKIDLSRFFGSNPIVSILRDGVKTYVIGLSQVVAFQSEVGEVLDRLSVPFMRLPLPPQGGIEDSIPPQRMSAVQRQLEQRVLEAASTDRNFIVLQSHYVIAADEGIKHMGKGGNQWEFKALPASILSKAQGLPPPALFADQDGFLTHQPQMKINGGNELKNPELQSYRFDPAAGTFVKFWALSLNHSGERPFDILSTPKTIYTVLVTPDENSSKRQMRLVAIDRDKGSVLWSIKMTSKKVMDHSLLATPNYLIYATESEVIARSAKTGAKVWGFDLTPSDETARLQFLNDARVLVQYGKKAFILNIKTGHPLGDLELQTLQPSPFIPRIEVLDPNHLLIYSLGGVARDKAAMIRLR